ATHAVPISLALSLAVAVASEEEPQLAQEEQRLVVALELPRAGERRQAAPDDRAMVEQVFVCRPGGGGALCFVLRSAQAQVLPPGPRCVTADPGWVAAGDIVEASAPVRPDLDREDGEGEGREGIGEAVVAAYELGAPV